MTSHDDPRIRAASADDVPRVVALLRRQLDEHDIALDATKLDRAVRGLLDATRPTRGHILVAVSGDEIVAVAVMSYVWTLEHGGPAAWLDELYVDPARRGRGIGAALVDAVTRVAAAAGCEALDLEVEAGHEAAERLYEHLGFRRHRRVRWARPIAAPAAPPSPVATVDHLSLGVNDLERSKRFYDAALAPLGLVPHIEIPGEVAYGSADGEQGSHLFYIGFEDPAARRPVSPSAGFHVAFHAPTRAAVRAFHAAALDAGGTDFGAPGPRPQYGPGYFGAFVLDPDGHHVEAVCHADEPGDERDHMRNTP